MEDYTQWELPKAAKMRLGKGGINDIQFSPDGTQLAVGNDLGIWLYDLKTGKEISLFPGLCESLAFSPDGRFLANGGFGKLRRELQVWEITTRRKISLTGESRPATALRFSEDSKTLVSVDSWGATISRLDIETGKKGVTELEGQPDSLGHLIEAYAFTHDRVAGGKIDGKIRLWDTTTGKKLTTLSGHAVENQDPSLDTYVLALAFSPDGTRLASGSTDTTIRLWDTATHNDEPTILRKHTGWINVLAFSPDGKMLASGSTDKTVQLWDTATGEPLIVLTEHLSSIAALTFSPDGSTLASGSTDGTIRFWDTATGGPLLTPITGHTQWVKAGTFLKDSSTFASVAFNGALTFWDLKTSEKITIQMTGDRDLLMGLGFSPDGTKLASTGTKGDVFFAAGFGHSVYTPNTDHVIRITDVRTGRELTKTSGHGRNLAFSSDGKTVAFENGVSIHLWDTETGKTLDVSHVDPTNETDATSENVINALAFSPDGKRLASGTFGGDVQIWNSETGDALTFFRKIEPLKGDHNRDPISTLAFCSDGAMLAVGSNFIRILMLGSKKQIGFKQMRGQAEALAFSPDTTVLVIGWRSGRIELWEITTGDQLTTLDGHTGPVETLTFSPDSQTLVSTGQDGTILVWDWDEALKGSP
ncbi:WD40 repeat domain-containing protein [Candidatus Poribacteria bacterium]|nr:WD40 repeat domain-containing protein [Candidatus Poribacteria bacterium]